MTTPSGFSVRPASTDDIPAARALMIRIFDEDFRSGYVPEFHRDVDDIAGAYIDPGRHALFVAVDDVSGELVGTAGVRGGALKGGPPDLVRRYDDEHTAQIVRIYVRREDRRRGIARALLRATLEFILADGGYSTIALHTFPHSPGALAFWESFGTKVGEHDWRGEFREIFFEIPLDRARELVAASPAR